MNLFKKNKKKTHSIYSLQSFILYCVTYMHKKYFYWTCFRLDAVTAFSASAHGFWVKLGFLQFIFCFRQQCYVAIIVFATGRHWEGGFQL